MEKSLHSLLNVNRNERATDKESPIEKEDEYLRFENAHFMLMNV